MAEAEVAGRVDIEDVECPVRVIKWGAGNLVTVKMRAGIAIHTTETGVDAAGDTMWQLHLTGSFVDPHEGAEALAKLLEAGAIEGGEAATQIRAIMEAVKAQE
jgi:hypothetical protein